MKNPKALKINETEPLELDPVFQANGDLISNEYRGTNNGEKQQLKQILAVLRRNWLMILTINLIVTALAIIYLSQKPESFKAAARVQVNTETNPAGTKSGGSVIVNSAGSDPVYFTTQLQILEGAGLLRRVVKVLDLEHNQAFLSPNKGQELTAWQNVLRLFRLYTTPPRLKENSETAFGKNSLNLKNESQLDSDAETEKLAPFVSAINKGLSVSPVKDNRTTNKETRLIEIEFTHQDPFVAAKITNAIADVYVLTNLEQKTESNATASDFLQKRVDELQLQIRLGEEQLINYSKDNQILSLDGSQNTVVQRLTDLNMKLGQSINDRITAEAAYRAAQQNPLASVTAQSKDPRTSQIESNLLTLHQRLDQLKTEYTDQWPDVVQTRRQIESLEKELQISRKRASDTQFAALEQVYRGALAQEREVRRNFETQRNEVLTQNEAAINYRILQQEIETNKTLHDRLLQQLRENDVVLNGTPNNVAVIDRALIPRSPVGPQTTKNILVAFLGSLAFGVALAFFRNWLDNTIRRTDDIEKQLGLPLLATIPLVASGVANRLLNFFYARKERKVIYDPAAFEKPEVVESYIQLRTRLLLSQFVESPQTVLVVSAESGEGKTTTALNLAKTLSGFSDKVLLIDADLRLPRLHSLLNLLNYLGLSTLLASKRLENHIIEATIQQVDNSNVYVLTAGPSVANPVDLLGSAEMPKLLNELTKQFSYIVFDSPPVLYFSDSVVLATLVDAVVLVVRDEVSSLNTVQRTRKMLLDVGAIIAGVALNGVTAQPTQRNRKYKYYRRIENQQSDQDHQSLKVS